jgi:hypothetical protein
VTVFDARTDVSTVRDDDTAWRSEDKPPAPPDPFWRYVLSSSDSYSAGYATTDRPVVTNTQSSIRPDTGAPLGDRITGRVVPVTPNVRPEGPAVVVTQEWEGVVVEVSEGLFSATIRPLDEVEPEFVVDIAMERVENEDLALVVPGAPLYLTIGFLRRGQGRKSQLSSIRFRRLPRWSGTGDVETWLDRGRARQERTGVYDDEEIGKA